MYVSSHLADLLGLGLDADAEIVVAVDTEYSGTHTLTVQAAARIDPRTVALQVYRSPLIAGPPPGFDPAAYLPPERYGRFCERIVFRPVRELTTALSPVRLLCDLFDLDGVEPLALTAGRAMLDALAAPGRPASAPCNASWQPRRGRWRVPTLTVTLAGHFLRADLARLFGRDFTAGLLAEDVGLGCTGKQLRFVRKGDTRNHPVVEYARGAGLHAVKVRTRDTQLIAGSGSLDALSAAYLGFGKCDAMSPADKADMLRAFREKPADCYGYAAADAVNTLLVYEQMAEADRDIYRSFGFAEDAVPPLHGTLGRRVSTLLGKLAWRHVGPSASLDTPAALDGLMRGGGVALFDDHRDASRYGAQTGRVHGGQLFSRSPTRFWHDAPGMLRDVDMSGCYPAAASRIHLYAGRPVVLEPGGRGMNAREAVDFVSRHAPRDGWLIKVSGPVGGFDNALIPSQDDAVTSLNYRQALRAGKRRQSRNRAFHLEALRDPTCVEGTVGTRLYSSAVESGVVTWATWQVIQALPESARRQYEALAADSVVFYPEKLVATGGREFDGLVERHGAAGLPWEESLDLDAMELVRRERIDSRFVALRVPLGDYARTFVDFRRAARDRDGRGSGADRTWKDYANTLYGVLASGFHPCNNFVAANVVTAWARAAAFVMAQSLNAIQTITDGCTWRADQVPAGTFADCLAAWPDYPVRRADGGEGFAFLDPAGIPADDEAFTTWYRGHARRFFGQPGAGFDEVVAAHDLVHKRTPGTGAAAFDALACDGASNYAKVVFGPDGGRRVIDFAARSFRADSKATILDWLVGSYAADALAGPAPLAEDRELMSYHRALGVARRAILGGAVEVVFPLGLEEPRVKNYRALKSSAFVFRTSAQRAAVLKQAARFEARYGCGLEVLALRRGYRGRRQGSLVDLAEVIYDFIRSGAENLTGALNLGRLSADLKDLSDVRVAATAGRRESGERLVLDRIDAGRLDPATLVTALVMTADQLGVRAGPVAALAA